MKRLALNGIFAAAVWLSPFGAKADDLAGASRAVDEGVPEVAIARLRDLLGKNLSVTEWRAAAAKMVEALIVARQPEEALKLLDDERLRGLASVTFWRAQALASLHRWEEALPFYQQVAATDASPSRPSAIFGAAEALRALGRGEESRQKLGALVREKEWRTRAQFRIVDSYLDANDAPNARRTLSAVQPASTTERKTKRFLQARLDLAEQQPERALGIFETLLKKPEGASHALVIATLFGVADAHLQLKTPEAGDDFVEDFIDHHPNDVDLPLIFSKLDELYRAERKPARAELERWTREPEQPRRAFAQWCTARIDLRAGRQEHAVRVWNDMRASAPRIASLAPAFIEFAEYQLGKGQFEEALSILDDARALKPDHDTLDRIDLMAASAEFRAGQYDKAATGFERIGSSRPRFARVSTYNAALSQLQMANGVHFAALYTRLEKEGEDANSRAELRLEEGLSQAARNDPHAQQTLQRFTRDFPQSARIGEAYVAMAELAFHRTPPSLDDARKYLSRAAESKPADGVSERAEYLSIWIEDASSGNDTKVIELARQFLEKHATSSFAPDVRMKLAETYYRLQDFANAQTHFQILGQQEPPTPFTEKATFFAGESAMSSMGENALERALVLFEQVVRQNGELRWAARNEQALIERKLGKPRDALLLYDEVLKGPAKPVDKREAVCGKGDIYVELASEDPKNYDRAIEAYDQLANDAHDPGHWRNQALFKKGVALEKKAEREAALTTFYEVLEAQVRPGRPPEFFWFYKAGFNAARLLEENSKWESAAAIYQRLVAAAGPGARKHGRG